MISSRIFLPCLPRKQRTYSLIFLRSHPRTCGQARKVDAVAITPTPSRKNVKGTFVPGLDPEEEDPANFSDGYDENAAAGPVLKDTKQQVVNAEEERKKTLALLGQMFGSASDDDADVGADEAVAVEAEAELDEEESSSDSSSESSSDSDSDSVARQRRRKRSKSN